MINHTRRTALKAIGTICKTILLRAKFFAAVGKSNRPVRLGVIADLLGGLTVDADSRLDAFLEEIAKQNCDALIQLGDFAFPNKKHQSYADKFNAAHKNTIHVIGNHEFDFGLTRADCFKAWGIESAYYQRDLQALRVLVLDGNEKGSPDENGYPSYIGNKQQNWLADELKTSQAPVLILSHQPLAGQSAIDNATDVQDLLSQHNDKIVLCINGHSHVDSLLQVNGVYYLHVNSASYYWVGGKTRMAYYRNPLFTTITIDPVKMMINVVAKTSSWKGETPAAIDFFDWDDAPPENIVVPVIRARQFDNSGLIRPTQSTWANKNRTNNSATALKVMTWNMWGRLNQDPRYTIDNKTARERTIEIIRESGADIVAMIETYGSAADIAEALKFYHVTPAADANLCVFSRYPLTDVKPLEGLSPFSFIAATASLPSGQKIYSRGSRLQTQHSKVITHHPSQLARSFPEFPSDHAAVLTEFRIHQ